MSHYSSRLCDPIATATNIVEKLSPSRIIRPQLTIPMSSITRIPLLLLVTFIITILSCHNASAGQISPILMERMQQAAQNAKKRLTAEEPTHHVLISMQQQVDPYVYYQISDVDVRAEALVKAKIQLAKVTQAPIIKYLQEKNIEFSSLWIENIITVEHATSDLIQWLGDREEVSVVRSDHPFTAQLAMESTAEDIEARVNDALKAAEEVSAEWGVKYVKAPQLWERGVKGAHMTVGIADTGVQYDHPAIVKKYRGYVNGSNFEHNYNWYDAVRKPIDREIGPYASKVPLDDNGHGTHCTGTICGELDEPKRPAQVSRNIGVAPEAQWIGCRNMYHGVGRPSLYIGCLQFMLAPTDTEGNNPRSERRPMVVSNSYGCPPSEKCEPNVMENAVASLKASGVFMSVAAGNEGYDGCSSISAPPGIYADVFSVGASNYQSDVIASFSSMGPVKVDGSYRTKPDLVAPGVNVLSSYPPNNYRSLSGTSMATPHVAGIVALLWSGNQKLLRNIDLTIEALHTSAHPMEVYTCQSIQSVPNNVYGFGNVDAFAAFTKSMKNETLVRV